MAEISAKYEQLIHDLRQDFRPQREWGEGRGLFLVIGHFLVGVAAGAWLFGLLFDYPPGLFAGFLLAGIGGIAHLGFLGRPERFWKMARHVRTAWVAGLAYGCSRYDYSHSLHGVCIFRVEGHSVLDFTTPSSALHDLCAARRGCRAPRGDGNARGAEGRDGPTANYHLDCHNRVRDCNFHTRNAGCAY